MLPGDPRRAGEEDPDSLEPEVSEALARTGGLPVYELLAMRTAHVSDEIRAERSALITGFILRAVADRARVLGRRRRPVRSWIRKPSSPTW